VGEVNDIAKNPGTGRTDFSYHYETDTAINAPRRFALVSGEGL